MVGVLPLFQSPHLSTRHLQTKQEEDGPFAILKGHELFFFLPLSSVATVGPVKSSRILIDLQSETIYRCTHRWGR